MTPARIAAGLFGPATLHWRVLLALLMGLVCALAVTPAPPPDLHLGWDKLNHTVAFAALGFCAALGWPAPRWARLAVLAALLAFGGMIELVQHFVPNRSAEWGDLLADAIGIGLGVLLATALLRLRPESTSRRR